MTEADLCQIDDFAKIALIALIPTYQQTKGDENFKQRVLAEKAYEIAETMMAERTRRREHRYVDWGEPATV